MALPDYSGMAGSGSMFAPANQQKHMANKAQRQEKRARRDMRQERRKTNRTNPGSFTNSAPQLTPYA